MLRYAYFNYWSSKQKKQNNKRNIGKKIPVKKNSKQKAPKKKKVKVKLVEEFLREHRRWQWPNSAGLSVGSAIGPSVAPSSGRQMRLRKWGRENSWAPPNIINRRRRLLRRR